MVGGYHKGEVNERFKDRDVTVSMTDVNIYSIRDVSLFSWILYTLSHFIQVLDTYNVIFSIYFSSNSI